MRSSSGYNRNVIGFPCRQAMDVGANLFIGNLDPEVRVHEKQKRRKFFISLCGFQVDEKLLYDTFSAFGVITGNTPKCMRDPETGGSKVSFSFRAILHEGTRIIAINCFVSFNCVVDAIARGLSALMAREQAHTLSSLSVEAVPYVRLFSQGYAFVNYDCFEAADMVPPPVHPI
jgi:hypothetical protein